MEKSKQSKNRRPNFIWYFVAVCFLIGGSLLLLAIPCNKNKIIKNENNGTKIKNLEEKVIQLQSIISKEELVLDGSSVERLIGNCLPNNFVNERNPVDQTIENSLRIKYNDFNNYINNDYALANACKSGSVVLFMLDKYKGRSLDYQAINEDVVIGYSNRQIDNLELWPITIDSYRPGRESGAMACNFEGFSKDKFIKYICVDATDASTQRWWYVFDIANEKNTKVKYTFSPMNSGAGEPNEGEIGEFVREVYDQGLLELFKNKEKE
jgi:hypothetical protein